MSQFTQLCVPPPKKKGMCRLSEARTSMTLMDLPEEVREIVWVHLAAPHRTRILSSLCNSTISCVDLPPYWFFQRFASVLDSLKHMIRVAHNDFSGRFRACGYVFSRFILDPRGNPTVFRFPHFDSVWAGLVPLASRPPRGIPPRGKKWCLIMGRYICIQNF